MKIITSSLLSATAICAVPAALAAQETQRFRWEGTIELGYDSVYDSDVAGAEVSDTYATIDFSAAERRPTSVPGSKVQPIASRAWRALFSVAPQSIRPRLRW